MNQFSTLLTSWLNCHVTLEIFAGMCHETIRNGFLAYQTRKQYTNRSTTAKMVEKAKQPASEWVCDIYLII